MFVCFFVGVIPKEGWARQGPFLRDAAQGDSLSCEFDICVRDPSRSGVDVTHLCIDYMSVQAVRL